MIKVNWFELGELKVYDSLGFDIEITDLSMKARKEIANAIISGHLCGSFESEVVSDVVDNLHPEFLDQLMDVVDMHEASVEQRQAESKEKFMKLQEEGEAEDEETGGEEDIQCNDV